MEPLELNMVHNYDATTGLKKLADESVHCIVTSPPYWALRNYGVEGQLGLEDTPEEYIENMVAVFREAYRILRKDGTCWINIGDTYYGGKGTNGASVAYSGAGNTLNKASVATAPGEIRPNDRPHPGLKRKDLVGIPWMLALALRKDGWYLRQDIIWHKSRAMPESVRDRCTKAHEYIFLLTKSPKYYFDAYAIATPYADKTYTTFGIENKNDTGHLGDGTGLIQSENWGKSIKVRKSKEWMGSGAFKGSEKFNGKNSEGSPVSKPPTHKYAWARAIDGSINDSRKGKGQELYEKSKGRKVRPDIDTRAGNQGNGNIPPMGLHGKGFDGHSGNFDSQGNLIGTGRANRRSVWTISPAQVADAHFATFPEELPELCIKAGCPEDGVVVDMFAGRGTTMVVARKHNRRCIGFEINPKYIEMYERYRHQELGLFK